jgi:hypothetical protein
VQQIPVRPVQFDGIDAGAHGALGRLDESVAHTFHIGFRNGTRDGPAGSKRNRGGSDGLPGVVPGIERVASLPWPLGGRLASGMGKLNADFRIPVAPTMGQDLPERCFAVVGIEPEAAVGDPPTPLGPGGLHHDQRCARIRQRAEMGEVPVGRDPVIGTVLAHRGDDDPVCKVEPGEPDRGEQGTGHEWRALTCNEKERASCHDVAAGFKPAGSGHDLQSGNAPSSKN